MGLDKDNEGLNNRCQVMRAEVDNNENRIANMTSVLMTKEDQIA